MRLKCMNPTGFFKEENIMSCRREYSMSSCILGGWMEKGSFGWGRHHVLKRQPSHHLNFKYRELWK